MTPAEFNDAYALCQILPGPTIVNLSVVFGRSIRGLPGAAVALVGLIGPGLVDRDLLRVPVFDLRHHRRAAAHAHRRCGGRRRPRHQHDRQDGGAAVRGEELAGLRGGRGGVRQHRSAALADLVGAARADSAEHRDRVAGAAMKHDGGILLTLARILRADVAVCDRRSERRHSRDASPGGRDQGLDDRPAVRGHVRARASDAGSQRHHRDPGRLPCRRHRGRSGRHARDVRAGLRVCSFRGQGLGPLQKCALAHRDPGRLGSDRHRADRGQRADCGAGGFNQLGFGRSDAGRGGGVLQADLESALDFRSCSIARTCRSGVGPSRIRPIGLAVPKRRRVPRPADVIVNSTDKSSRLLSAGF